MEQVRKILKISGILKCIMGVLLLEIPIYGGFLVFCGFILYLLSEAEEKDIYKYNFLNIVIGVLGFFDIIGSILQFINFEHILRVKHTDSNAPPKVKYQMNPEQKRLDILLKLGVGMVFIAGLLFATTSWEFISDFLKVCFLILFGFGFLGLSLFSEIKLKIYRSSYLYWTLSMALFVLSVVAIFYFQLFGSELSYFGDASSLAYAITYFTIGGFSFITYLKYPKKGFIYCSFSMILLIGYSIFEYFEFSSIVILLIFSILSTVLIFIPSKYKVLHLFHYLFTFILFAFMISIENTNDFIYILIGIIHLFNFQFLIFQNPKKDLNILYIIVSFLILLLLSYRIEFLFEWNHLMAGLSFTLYSLLILTNIIPISLKYHKYLLILYTVFMGIFVFASYDMFYIVILALLSILLIEAVHFGLFDIHQDSFLTGLEVVSIFYLIYSIITYLSNCFFHSYSDDAIFLFSSAVSSCIYAIFHKFYHFNPSKKAYFYGIVITSFLVLLMNTEYSYLFSSILVIISCLYLFASTYLKALEDSTYRYKMLGLYVLLLSSIYIPFVYLNIFELNEYILVLFMISILVMVSFILKDQAITKISCLYVILPFTYLIRIMNIDYIWEQLLGNMIVLYVVLFVLYFYVKDTIARNIISIITIVVFFFDLLVLDDIIINIYMGIVGLIVLLFTFQKKEYTPIFIAVIVATILNILDCLKELWDSIPFWFYLLIGGLLIIGFVTNVEIKKNLKNEKSLKK